MANCGNKREVFKTSEASTKAWFRTKNIIDSFWNISNLPEFRKQTTIWTNYAKSKHNIDEGRLLFEENNGTKAVPNRTAFHKIDASQGIFYKDNEYLKGMYQNSSKEEVNESLDNKLKGLLKKIGITVISLDNIKDREGNVVDAVAKADLLQATIEIVEGKRGLDTLTEETSHFLFELLPQDHPLLLAAYTRVESTDMYKKVKEEYKDLYNGNEELIKKEAIGKLISQEVVKLYTETNESPASKVWINSWFSTLINWFKNKFKGLTSNEVYNVSEPFKSIAQIIINEDLRGLKKIDEVVESKRSKPLDEYFYQLNSASKNNQEKIIKLLETKLITSTEDGYVRNSDNVKVKHRVSNKTKAFYEGIFGKEKDDNKLSAQKLKGTYLHKIKQLLMDRIIEGKAYDLGISEIRKEVLNQAKEELLKQKEFQEAYKEHKEDIFVLGDTFSSHIMSAKSLSDSTKAIYDNIQENQKKLNTILNEKGVAKIFTELVIYDDVKDIGGTIDLLVVYSNGTVGIYDYKGMDFTDKKFVPLYKEEAFELQLNSYVQILHDRYAVENVAESVIIPTGMILNEGNPFKVKSMQDVSKDDKYKSYLNHIPIKSMTFDKDVNSVLKKLYDQQDKLKAELKKDYKNLVLKAKLYKVSQAIKSLILKDEFKNIIEIVNDISEDYHNREQLTKEAPDNLDDKYLDDISLELTMYEDIIKTISNKINEDKDSTDKDKYFLYTALGQVSILKNKIEMRMRSNIHTYSPNVDLGKSGKQVGLMSRLFKPLSDIDHPAFKILSQVVRNNSNATREDVNKVVETVEEKQKNLNEWAKSQGISIYDAYRKIIQKTSKGSTKLIDKFTKDYYDQLKEAKESKNRTWLLNNMQINFQDGKYYYNDDIQKELNEARERYIVHINQIYGGKKYAEKREDELNRWDSKYNITINPSALFNAKNFFLRPKDNPRYFTAEWNYMQQNKPLKEFYEMLVAYNKEFAAITGKEIKHNFIANIHKDIISKVSQNGLSSLFEMQTNITDSLQVRQQDVIKGNIDPSTGEPLQSIPLLFTDVIEAESKSDDLSRNLILFAKSAYSHKYLSETESLVKNIKAIISSSEYKTQVLGNDGKLLKNNLLGKIIEKSGLNHSDIETFEKFINMYWYGQTISGDVTFNLFGKEVSTAKVVGQLQKYIALKSLGLNSISAAGNTISSYTSLMVQATEGRYFTGKNLKQSRQLLSTNSEKYLAIIELLEPYSHDMITEKANKLSGSQLEKILTMDHMLFMMKKPDEFLERNLLVAMMHNYGVVDGKIVKVKEGEQTLVDLIEKDKEGNWSISGVSKEELWRFRHVAAKVGNRIKGTLSDYDKNLVNTTILGSVLMQFKNWIPGTLSERYGELRFDETLQDFDQGRMRVAFQQLVGSKTFKDNLVEFKNLLGEVVTGGYLFGGLKKINTEVAEKYREKFLDENPEISRDDLTLEQYVELRKQKLQGAVMELRVILSFMMLIFALKAMMPDDDKDKISKLIAKNGYMVANRGFLELTFFYSPKSVDQLITSPFTLYGLVNDLSKWTNNTFDESRDLLVGENSKQDKSPLGYYTVTKFLPFGKPLSQVFDFYDTFNMK